MEKVIAKTIVTPIGEMLAGTTDEGICLLEFRDRQILTTQIDRVKALFNADLENGDHPLLNKLETEIEEYFHHGRQSFGVPVVYPGSIFQVRVWESLRTIPYGSVRSYQQQAELIGNPKAIRAMAKANGDNRIAILIPCHRIIGNNGEMVGYSGKTWRKKYLLELEGALVKQGALF